MKRSSVRPSVCLSVSSFDRSRSLRWVCCWALCGQKIVSIDSGGRRAPSGSGASARGRKPATRCSATNVNSVTLTADVGSWTDLLKQDIVTFWVKCCRTYTVCGLHVDISASISVTDPIVDATAEVVRITTTGASCFPWDSGNVWTAAAVFRTVAWVKRVRCSRDEQLTGISHSHEMGRIEMHSLTYILIGMRKGMITSRMGNAVIP